VDPLDDSVQDAFDLEAVSISKDASWFSVTYDWEANAGFDPRNNLELSVSVRPIGSEDGYRRLTTFIGGGSRVTAKDWNSATGDTPVRYEFTDSRNDTTWTTRYDAAAISHFGDSFEWSAHAIYNLNGHDACGTAARSLDWDGRWFAYQP
jgi:hypothetical protein